MKDNFHIPKKKIKLFHREHRATKPYQCLLLKPTIVKGGGGCLFTFFPLYFVWEELFFKITQSHPPLLLLITKYEVISKNVGKTVRLGRSILSIGWNYSIRHP